MSDYRVLARKYRPQNFDDLVGQEVLVRTLRNAFASGRIAHAFLLTGIRGIGKTTTARIIAKALNCIGEDGSVSAPTITPCGVCANCQQIREDRHVDVLEMDAASHTGVGDVREIIEASRYKPSSGRYKVYIIDEAHMLSNSAFNALLKTLEEPPAHVVFVLATTEIRKIPVTILSRCQRFDLRRLETEEMARHLGAVAEKEGVQAQTDALDLIAVAAEGSVRDGLSLLDQAIAHTQPDASGGVQVEAETVRDLLGLADRRRLYALLEHLFAGKAAEALPLVQALYSDGAVMATLVQELMQAVHMIGRMLVVPGYRLDATYSDHERESLSALASRLSVPAVTRAWQLLLKGQEEIKQAQDALGAAEMLCIRFAYASGLPDPAEVLATLRAGESGGGAMRAASGAVSHAAQPVASGALALHSQPSAYPEARAQATPTHLSLVAHNRNPAPEEAEPELVPPVERIDSLEAIIALLEREREAILLHHVKTDLRPLSCTLGELMLGADSGLSTDMTARLRALLNKHTGESWRIVTGERAGEASLAEREAQAKQARMDMARKHPLVAAILANFPDSTMLDVE